MFASRRSRLDLPTSVARFLDLKRDTSSRYRRLQFIYENTAEPDKRKAFFEEHYFESFQLFQDMFFQIDLPAHAPGVRANMNELEYALWILETLFCYLPELVSKRWQYNCIAYCLKRLLHPQSFLEVRRFGLKLFLLWYQCLGIGPYGATELDEYFSSLIPNLPVRKDLSSEMALQLLCESAFVRLHDSPDNLDGICVAKKPQPIMCRYAVLCFRNAASFDLYNPQFVSQDNSVDCNLASTNPEDPFIVCQSLLISWVVSYTFSHKKQYDSFNRNEINAEKHGGKNGLAAAKGDVKLPVNYVLFRKVLFGSLSTVNFTFGILRESFLMPFSFVVLMYRVFKTLREWLLSKDKPPFFNPSPTSESGSANCAFCCIGVQKSVQGILVVLSTFFCNKYLLEGNEYTNVIVRVSNMILALFSRLAKFKSDEKPDESSPVMNEATWQFLLTVLLRITQDIIPVTPTVLKRPHISLHISSSVFRTLIGIWACANVNVSVPNEMWDKLTILCSSRTAWLELIVEWGNILVLFTRALGIHLYGVDVCDPPLERLSEQKTKRRLGVSRSLLPSEEVLEGGSGTAPGTGASVGMTEQQEYNFCQFPEQATVSCASVKRNSTCVVHAVTVADADDLARAFDLKTEAALPEASEMEKSPTKMTSSAALETTSATPSAETSDQALSVEEDESAASDDSDFDADHTKLPHVSLDDTKNAAQSDDVSADSSLINNDADSISEEFVTPEEPNARSPSLELLPKQFPEDDGFCRSSTPENYAIAWRRIVGILGDINEITDASIHLRCLKILETVINSFFKIRFNQGVAIDGSASKASALPPSLVPPFTIFAPWLITSLKLSKSYRSSKILAVRLICRIYARRQDVPLSRVDNASFLLVLHNTLLSDQEELILEVVKNCAPEIFYRNVSGCQALLYDLYRGCMSILNSHLPDGTKYPPVATFAASTICLVASLKSIPCIDSQNRIIEMDAEKLLFDMVGLLSTVVKKNVDDDVTVLSLKGLSLFVFSQLVKGKFTNVLRDSFTILLNGINFSNCKISLCICQMLHPLLSVIPQLITLFQFLIEDLFTVYLMALQSFLETTDADALPCSDLKQRLQTRILLDLCQWCLSLPPEFIASPERRQSFLLSYLRLIQLCFIKASQRSCSVLPKVVCALLNCYFDQKLFPYSFSAPERPPNEMIGVYSSLKNRHIAAFESVDKGNSGVSGSECSRFAFRNIVEKHSWQIRRLNRCGRPSRDLNRGLLSLSLPNDKSRGGSKRGALRPSDDFAAAGSHFVDSLLDYLLETSPECFLRSACGEEAAADFDSFIPDIPVIKPMKLVAESECHSRGSMMTFIEYFGCADRFSACRMLLDAFYHHLWETTGSVKLLEKSRQLNLELKHIDNIRLHELHKIAVIYVAPGQEDKQSILSNRTGSKAFERFISALGWEVDLKTHLGYMGGLPPDGTTAYYCTPMLEVIFHISTRLSCTDINKKLRHLGNDEVHIVWSEHWRDYRRSIIPTEFCDVLIVIYPLTNDVFRVHIEYDNTISDFGPLFNDALVSWDALSELIRTTAVNASRSKRGTSEAYKTSHEHRFESLENVADHLAENITFGELVAGLFSPSPLNKISD
ncbi:unnamed protein product [Soboliphyme baturini]|uniref:Rap-GAP domain-containing protein n=1 Tax=Soboliphyme baturini TaxID=241478 RepID=A0A183IUC9_9BILA|nr:unnamed protein product [Soboliphyme baturini]